MAITGTAAAAMFVVCATFRKCHPTIDLSQPSVVPEEFSFGVMFWSWVWMS